MNGVRRRNPGGYDWETENRGLAAREGWGDPPPPSRIEWKWAVGVEEEPQKIGRQMGAEDPGQSSPEKSG